MRRVAIVWAIFFMFIQCQFSVQDNPTGGFAPSPDAKCDSFSCTLTNYINTCIIFSSENFLTFELIFFSSFKEIRIDPIKTQSTVLQHGEWSLLIPSLRCKQL